MSKPTKDRKHGPLFVCNLCYDAIPQSSTLSAETVLTLAPEPREPAAREAAFTFAVAQGVTDGKYLDMQLVGEKFGGLFAFMEAYSAELRAERDKAEKDYRQLEGILAFNLRRAEAAEASLVKAREALKSFGNHTAICPWKRTNSCRCGWLKEKAAALSPGGDRMKLKKKLRRSQDAQVSVHPHIMSGQECVSGTRIPVFMIAGRFIAGEKVSFIAKDYDITQAAVEQAIRYVLCKARRLKRAEEMVRHDNF